MANPYVVGWGDGHSEAGGSLYRQPEAGGHLDQGGGGAGQLQACPGTAPECRAGHSHFVLC